MGRLVRRSSVLSYVPNWYDRSAERNESEGDSYIVFRNWKSGFHIVDSLGCTAIYIGPLFESTSHGYDTKDYKLVDRRLGDNEDFKHFVKTAHDKGIKVVVDKVYLTIPGVSFLLFRIFRRIVKILRIAAGIKESISDGIHRIMTALDMKHGETALSL